MIQRFSDISSSDVTTCGGKGASLGELTQAGFPVPNGFVLTTSVFGQASDVREQGVYDAFDQLDCQFVAVRSSGTKEDGLEDSFAGQFDTYLFVTRDQLINKIIQCHESIHSDRITSYCQSKGIDPASIKVAVVIQKMINSDVAGVCFTVNPISGNREEVMIEAGYGVGEAVVSGLITPDNYIVHKTIHTVHKSVHHQDIKLVTDMSQGGTQEVHLTQEEGSRQKLSDADIITLADYAQRIEQHYATPMDIERAVQNGLLYILQARPITTLTSSKAVNTLNKDDYMLSFWVKGMSVLMTDIIRDMYVELEVLYIVYQGVHKQYFTKSGFERALEYGVEFYGDVVRFQEYEDMMRSTRRDFSSFYHKHIATKSTLTKEDVLKFFEYSIQLLIGYTKMDFEYTDKAFTLKDSNPAIAHTLGVVATLKDDIRASLNMIFFEKGGYLDTLLSTLSSQLTIPYTTLEHFLRREVVQLFDGMTVSDTLLTERAHAFVADSYHTDMPYYQGIQAQQIALAFEDQVSDTSEITGVGASNGKAIGKIKKILVDYSDLEGMNEQIKQMSNGDILVAETTAPELMAACTKASAIITDMGGLMSHAAIVSRELGIPCVVGTKHASRVLKDGDIVQVDADRGVIKVL